MLEEKVIDLERRRRAGSQRLAMRTGSSANANLKWLLGDHLGSPSLTADYNAANPVTTLYKPWGGRKRRFRVRYQSGTLPTQYTYTGQYSHTADFGLMYYVARWYDPVLGRFAQADTIIPGPYYPASYDRYSYTLNNPLRYTDPTGHASNEKKPCPRCWGSVEKWIELGIIFAGSWTDKRLAEAVQALNWIRKAIGLNEMIKGLGLDKGLTLIGYTKAEWEQTYPTRTSHQSFYIAGTNTIHFYQPQNNVYAVIHEIGHVVDYHAGGGADYSTTHDWPGWEKDQDGKWIYDNREKISSHSYLDPREDFADTFAAWVLEVNGSSLGDGKVNNGPQHRQALMDALDTFE